MGDSTARLDNLWRGLPQAMVRPVEEAVTVLLEEGHLVAFGSPSGTTVAVHADAKGLVSTMAEGGALPDPVAAALKA